MMSGDDVVGAEASARQDDTGNRASLTELLPPERIRLGVEVGTWQDAVREAGRLLLQTNAVTSDYIEAMIRVAEELGPYIAIAPGIALPHAASEAGAKRTALSFVKLSKAVKFGNPDNDPVRLVFALSAIDKHAHMLALQTLAELFMSKDLMNELSDAETVEAVTQVFQRAQIILKK